MPNVNNDTTTVLSEDYHHNTTDIKTTNTNNNKCLMLTMIPQQCYQNTTTITPPIKTPPIPVTKITHFLRKLPRALPQHYHDNTTNIKTTISRDKKHNLKNANTTALPKHHNQINTN